MPSSPKHPRVQADPFADCWQADVPRLRRHLRRPDFEQQLATSRARVAARLARRPAISYPPDLPVAQQLDVLRKQIAEHQVVVICGETGSGKSTQLPKLLLEMGRGSRGFIAHTQPRRVAARAIARRLSEELGTTPGQEVGYRIRFHDQVSADSYIKVLTDGMLLAEIQGDRFLDQYDTIIIDEAHERSLNIDFLLGYLKRLLPRRPDLKVIITSATIDPESFARHFDNAPVITVSGRSFPVEIRYQPLDEQDEEQDVNAAIQQAIETCWRELPGDVLVFLPGERDIREAADYLRRHLQRQRTGEVEILPLFSRLSAPDQDRIFHPGHANRIVLATNVAETSLTVPRIRYVIDTGSARISRYSWRRKIQRLPVERISQASAAQRAGRCGRVADGVCVRLYSEDDFLARPAFTDPEILRTNLAAVILQMESMQLGRVEEFPFLDMPDERLVSDGYRLLNELQALDADGGINDIGRELARLPVDPRLARIILAARERQCLAAMLVIAAALAIQDPRERPLEKAEAADRAHAEFQHPDSDFLGLLNIWNAWQAAAKQFSGNGLRKWCKAHFLSYLRLREWQDIHRQLIAQAMTTKERARRGGESSEVNADAIHQAMLPGFLSMIGMRDDDGSYLAARNLKFRIFPGSALFPKGRNAQGPKWVMTTEIVETGQVWARKVARIEPHWIERVAGHLLQREYHEPHWDEASGRVSAYEKATLFGLPVVAQRRTNYGPINPPVARELFIREALVRQAFASQHPFLAHNRKIIEQVEQLEARIRRRDILVEEPLLEAWFAERLPPEVYDGITFNQWYRRNSQAHDAMLCLTEQDVTARETGDISAEAFPTLWPFSDSPLALEYALDPQGEHDGVSLLLPVERLPQVTRQQLDWLVSGFLQEKVVALIRSLPKAIRRQYVPAPEFARACVDAMEFGEGDLLEAVNRQLVRMSGSPFDISEFDLAQLPAHLLMTIVVMDGEERLAVSNDLRELQQRFAGYVHKAINQLSCDEWPERHATQWVFGDRPARVILRQGAREMTVYPALEDRNHCVAAVLAGSVEIARSKTRTAVFRLLEFGLRKAIQFATKSLSDMSAVLVQYRDIGDREQLTTDVVAAAIETAMMSDTTIEPGELAGEQAYRQLEEHVAARLQSEVNEIWECVRHIIERRASLRRELQSLNSLEALAAGRDMREQLDQLVYAGFVRAAGKHALREIPRYLEAIGKRIEKIQRDPARDARQQAELREPLMRWQALQQDKPQLAATLSAAREYRWLLEEFRVSLFAQELGTRQKVSGKRLDEQWEQVRKAIAGA